MDFETLYLSDCKKKLYQNKNNNNYSDIKKKNMINNSKREGYCFIVLHFKYFRSSKLKRSIALILKQEFSASLIEG